MIRRMKYAGLCSGILALLLLGACSPHEFPTSEGGDPGKDFSVRLKFVDDLPVLRTVDGDTKASGQSSAYRYSVELLRYVDDVSYRLTPDYVYSFTRSERITELDTTVYLPIDPARYRVVAWVDQVYADGSEGYDLSDFEYISVAKGYERDIRLRDAFSGAKVLDLEGMTTAGEVYQETLKLTRPVARLRFFAPEALTFLSRAGVDAASMKASLTYTAIPEGYNLLRDMTTSTLKSVTLTSVPQMNTEGELEFCTDHLFSTAEGTTVNVDFRVTGPENKVICSYTGEVPIRRAHETCVTFGAGGGGGGGGTPGGIGISPGFDSEIEIPISGLGGKETQILRFFFNERDVTGETFEIGPNFDGARLEGAKTKVTYSVSPQDGNVIPDPETGELLVDPAGIGKTYTVTANAIEDTVEGVTYAAATAYYAFKLVDDSTTTQQGN